MTAKPRISDMLTRRRFLEGSGLVAGGVLLGACGSDGETVAATTAAPADTAAATTAAPAGGGIPMTTITNPTLGYSNPNAVLRAPIFVGQTKGFFEEVGIENIEVNDADEYMAALVSGSFDVSLVDSDVLFGFNESEAEGESLGIKMIGLNQGSQPLIMIANEGVTAENLGGKKVGGARAGSVNEAISKFILGELGYDWETDVEFTTLTGGSNDWVTAMLSGQIDATVAFPRHIQLATDEGGSALF
ncbi:MAG: ABC transporter substrate-binding protein [Acidimicrobiales bacterium]